MTNNYHHYCCMGYIKPTMWNFCVWLGLLILKTLLSLDIFILSEINGNIVFEGLLKPRWNEILFQLFNMSSMHVIGDSNTFAMFLGDPSHFGK